MSADAGRTERSWTWMLTWVAGGLAVGLLLVALTRWAGLCNDQAQVIILAVTAGVGAGYAAVTREMARATRDSAESSRQMARAARDDANTSRKHFEAACCPQLVAYLVEYAKGGADGCVCRVVNYTGGTATNVRLRPLWDTAKNDAKLDISKVAEKWCDEDIPASNLGRRELVLPGGACREVVVTNPRSKNAVLCVRWDDPAKEMRFWKCWALELEPKRTRHTRKLLTGPKKDWGCENCDERDKDTGQCPLTFTHDEKADLFGKED